MVRRPPVNVPRQNVNDLRGGGGRGPLCRPFNCDNILFKCARISTALACSFFFLSHSTPHQQSLRCCNFVRRLLRLRNHPPKVLQRTQSPPKGNALSFYTFFLTETSNTHTFHCNYLGRRWRQGWRCRGVRGIILHGGTTDMLCRSLIGRWVRDKGDLSL